MPKVNIMGSYKYITETFQKEYKEKSPLYKERIMKWRREGPVVKIEKPTVISRARTLGYKAKKGIIVVRARVRKGNRKTPNPIRGRKPSHSGRFFRSFSPGNRPGPGLRSWPGDRLHGPIVLFRPLFFLAGVPGFAGSFCRRNICR